MKMLYEKSGLSVDHVIYHDDIYNSNLILPWLSPIINKPIEGGRRFLKTLLRYATFQLNQLLVRPILVKARAQNKGGIITIIGTKD